MLPWGLSKVTPGIYFQAFLSHEFARESSLGSSPGYEPHKCDDTIEHIELKTSFRSFFVKVSCFKLKNRLQWHTDHYTCYTSQIRFRISWHRMSGKTPGLVPGLAILRAISTSWHFCWLKFVIIFHEWCIRMLIFFLSFFLSFLFLLLKKLQQLFTEMWALNIKVQSITTRASDSVSSFAIGRTLRPFLEFTIGRCTWPYKSCMYTFKILWWFFITFRDNCFIFLLKKLICTERYLNLVQCSWLPAASGL